MKQQYTRMFKQLLHQTENLINIYFSKCSVYCSYVWPLVFWQCLFSIRYCKNLHLAPSTKQTTYVQIQIHLFTQKSEHTGPEDTDTCPTKENSSTMKHTSLSELYSHKGVKSTHSSHCWNTEMLRALTISLDKLFQISITRVFQISITRCAKLYFCTLR